MRISEWGKRGIEVGSGGRGSGVKGSKGGRSLG